MMGRKYQHAHLMNGVFSNGTEVLYVKLWRIIRSQPMKNVYQEMYLYRRDS